MITFLAEHWLDIVTTVLGLAYILLEYKASVWMWLAVLMQALGIVLYYQKGLSMPTVVWSSLLSGDDSLRLLEMDSRHCLERGAACAPFPTQAGATLAWNHRCRMQALIYWLLVTFTKSNVPMADSFTTALSIVGIWALAHKYLEQWFIWIAVDVVTCISNT